MVVDNELIKQIKITPLLDTLKLEDIEDDIYFKQYSKEYISNSRLGKLTKEGVEAFFKNEPSPYNPSFETGKKFKKFLNLPSINEKVNRKLQTENGEICDDNPVLSSEIKESEPV